MEGIEFKPHITWAFWSTPLAVELLFLLLLAATLFGTNSLWSLLFVIPMALIACVYVSIAVKTMYVFTDEGLIVKGIHKDIMIRYSSVKRITDTKEWTTDSLLSYILSGDRIGILYDGGRKHVIISPSNKDKALALLRTRCPFANFEIKVSKI